jgi:hypothetical protein
MEEFDGGKGDDWIKELGWCGRSCGREIIMTAPNGTKAAPAAGLPATRVKEQRTIILGLRVSKYRSHLCYMTNGGCMVMMGVGSHGCVPWHLPKTSHMASVEQKHIAGNVGCLCAEPV